MKIKSEYVKLNSNQRLYNLDIPIIGLTGGIATGKSSVAAILRSQNIPLIDADQLVKEIYRQDDTIAFIKQELPIVIHKESINFNKLRTIFFSDPITKDKIERYIYSRLPKYFSYAYNRLQSHFVIYDVPLLFEKELQHQVDTSICVYCTPAQQRERLARRDQCSNKEMDHILKHQTDINTKIKLADFTIDNTNSIEQLSSQTKKVLEQIIS